MENGVQNGIDLGYLDIPEGTLVDANEINHTPPEKAMILCTGSQGEPLAALSRIADGTHRQISLQPGDTVIFSSNPIPGNTTSVNHLINKLTEAGANVVHGKIHNVHTSGHAGQEEQKMMIELTKPEYFIPVHGEYRMQVVHTETAQSTGMPKDHTFVLKNGDVLALTRDSSRIAGHINIPDVFVDTSGSDDVGNIVVRDRQILAEEGLVGGELFVAHARVEHILAVVDGVGGAHVREHVFQQYIEGDVAQVFGGELLQQVDTGLLRGFGTQAGEEVSYHTVVAAGGDKQFRDDVGIQFILRGKATGCVGRGECGDVGVADGVFLRKAAGVFGTLFGGDGRQFGAFGWGNDVEVEGIGGGRGFVQDDAQVALLAEGELGEAEATVLGCPHEHVATAGGE